MDNTVPNSIPFTKEDNTHDTRVLPTAGTDPSILKCTLIDGVPTFTNLSLQQQSVATSDELFTINEGFARTFMLNNPEDIQEYQRVIDLVAKGLAVIEDRHVNYDSNHGCHVVALTWFETHFEYGADVQARAYQDKQGRIAFHRPWQGNR